MSTDGTEACERLTSTFEYMSVVQNNCILRFQICMYHSIMIHIISANGIAPDSARAILQSHTSAGTKPKWMRSKAMAEEGTFVSHALEPALQHFHLDMATEGKFRLEFKCAQPQVVLN